MRPSTRHLIAVSLFFLSTAADAHAIAAGTGRPKRECLSAYENSQRFRRRGNLKQSVETLHACMKDACPAVLRRDCASWLGEVERAMPSAVFVVRDGAGADVSDVEVYVEDELVTNYVPGKAIPLDPGTLHVRFERAPFPAVERVVVLAEGEKDRRIEVEMGPPRPAAAAPALVARPSAERASVDVTTPVPGLVYVLAGIGLASAGAGSVFLVRGNQEKSELEVCRPDCDPNRVESSRASIIAGDVMLGVGAAALVTAAIVFVTRGRTTIGATSTVQGAFLRAGGTF